MMYWEQSHDPQNQLLDAIYRGLNPEQSTRQRSSE
jgi:hypothetical protein